MGSNPTISVHTCCLKKIGHAHICSSPKGMASRFEREIMWVRFLPGMIHCRLSSMAEHRACTSGMSDRVRQVASKTLLGRLAQLVAQLVYTEKVLSSNLRSVIGPVIVLLNTDGRTAVESVRYSDVFVFQIDIGTSVKS